MLYTVRPGNIKSYRPQATCLIIGITSLTIFLLNIVASALTPELYSIQWRVSFLEQVGNRSIALLFGFGLVFYGLSEQFSLRKKLAFVCLMSGILFQMGGLLIIHDTQALQAQALQNITRQTSQVKQQIQSGQSEVPTVEAADRAVQQLEIQERELQQRAKTEIMRAGVVSLGNLVIPGIGLMGLGWLGLRQ